MKDATGNHPQGDVKIYSRKDFIKTTAAVSLTAALPGASRVFAAGSDTIKVGLVGCGGRGTGAAADCLVSSPGVELVAIGDLFQDQVDKALERIESRIKRHGNQGISADLVKSAQEGLKVGKSKRFTGFDNFKKVISQDIDLLILATPPHFRPEHLAEAVKRGKHIFMEKPVAVDPKGIRSVIASSGDAQKKKLAIVAGTQRRHQLHYLDIMKRIHDGALGELVGGQCYWNMGALWVERAMNNLNNIKEKNWTEMEYQIRNWLFYTWLSGDHIVEQHVHNIDVINWAFGGHPVKAMGMGGRQARTEPQYGNIFDHFAIEYEYENGARIQSMCRQTKGAADRVSERVVGTKGVAYLDSGGTGKLEGANAHVYDGPSPNPYVQEHTDLIAGIRNGRVLNEGQQIAESNLSAIMGRMSAYTGRELSWDWVMKGSKLDLTPPKYVFGGVPEEFSVVAVPGETPLV